MTLPCTGAAISKLDLSSWRESKKDEECELAGTSRAIPLLEERIYKKRSHSSTEKTPFERCLVILLVCYGESVNEKTRKTLWKIWNYRGRTSYNRRHYDKSCDENKDGYPSRYHPHAAPKRHYSHSFKEKPFPTV
eukprot:TCONS_00020791-protein